MIHYFGLPITPATAAVKAIQGGHAFISYAHPEQLGIALEVAQSYAIDNGAYSAWRSGNPVKDWSGFYTWAQDCLRTPSCDFAVIPDVMEGSEEENDELVNQCPLPLWFAAPVWHTHESLNRLDRLVRRFPRVCIGSSEEHGAIGSRVWWGRMGEAMVICCDDTGRPKVKLHGLKMLNPRVFTKLPLASADSVSIGRNIGIDQAWKGTYTPPTKEARAMILRQRNESFNAPLKWDFTMEGLK